MPRRDTDFTHHCGGKYHQRSARINLFFRADDVDVQRHCHKLRPFVMLKSFGFLCCLFNGTDHIKDLLRQGIEIPIDNGAEAFDGVFE